MSAVWVGGIETAVSPAYCPCVCARLVFVSCFPPCPWGLSLTCWDLQILLCGTTTFLSIGSLSGGKGNNFLKSIQM